MHQGLNQRNYLLSNHRHGGIDDLTVRLQGKLMHFLDLESHDEEETMIAV